MIRSDSPIGVMSRESIDSFLRKPQIGVLGVSRPGKPPHLTPVWYLYDGDVIWIPSERDVAKTRDIRREPQVTFCVDDRTPPHKGVVVYGKAELLEENIYEIRRDVMRHYVGKEEGDRQAAEPRPRGIVVFKLAPERFFSWDYGAGEQGWKQLSEDKLERGVGIYLPVILI